MKTNLFTTATVSTLLIALPWLPVATYTPAQATETKPAPTQPATDTKNRDLTLKELVPALQEIINTAQKNGGKISEAEINSIFKARIAATSKGNGTNTTIQPTPKPTTDATKPPTTTQPASSQSEADLEQAVFNQINQYRSTQGLPPLKLNASITKQARQHSQNMASGKVSFGHSGFDGRVKEIGKDVKYTGAGENVAWNKGSSDPAQQAVQGWLKSSGHLANIRGNYGLTGIGVSKNSQGQIYFTQIFIRQ